MGIVARTLSTISQSYSYMFLFGMAGGVGFELFKINFSPKGVNFYSVFKRNQLKRELGNLETELQMNERQFLAQQKSIE